MERVITPDVGRILSLSSLLRKVALSESNSFKISWIHQAGIARPSQTLMKVRFSSHVVKPALHLPVTPPCGASYKVRLLMDMLLSVQLWGGGYKMGIWCRLKALPSLSNIYDDMFKDSQFLIILLINLPLKKTLYADRNGLSWWRPNFGSGAKHH